MSTARPQPQHRSPTDREITTKTDSDLLLRLAELSEPANSPFPWDTKVTSRVEPPPEGIFPDAPGPADELGFDSAPLSPMAARREAESTAPYCDEKGVHADPSAWLGSDAYDGFDERIEPSEHSVGLDDLTPSDPAAEQPLATARIRALSGARGVAAADGDELDVATLTTHPSPWRFVALVGLFALGSLLVALYHLLFGLTPR